MTKAGIQQQLKWAEGKPGEYGLLGGAARAAASHGQLRKARELLRRSVESTQRLNFKDATANTYAHWALLEAEFENSAKARELAESSTSLVHGLWNLPTVAIALAMAGDASRAQAIVDDLGRRFPLNTVLHQVNMPCVQAILDLNRGTPAQSIQVLQSAAFYELGTAYHFLPIYIRGLAYLRLHQSMEAAGEFQKIIDHRGIDAGTQEYSLARLGLARAYTLSGDTAKARSAYQDFLALWKDADPDIPILKQAKTEYAKLQ